MAQQAVTVHGLTELRRELRKLEEPKGWTRELAAVNRSVAKHLEPLAQGRARAAGGQSRRFAGAIRGYGSAASARLALASSKRGGRYWGADAAYWGVKDNVSGWNRSSTPNLKTEWVGASWDVAAGQGPAPLVDTVVAEADWIVNTTGDGVDRLTRRAFPD